MGKIAQNARNVKRYTKHPKYSAFCNTWWVNQFSRLVSYQHDHDTRFSILPMKFQNVPYKTHNVLINNTKCMLVTNILELPYIKLYQKCLSFFKHVYYNDASLYEHFRIILYKCIFILNRTKWIVHNSIKHYKKKKKILCF